MNDHCSYFNAQADVWDEKKLVEEKKVAAIIAKMGVQRGETVLDVGCGTGICIPFLLAGIGEGGRVIGLDFAEQMIKQAQSKFKAPNLSFVNADIINTGLEENLFHKVVCFSCFPHFPDKRRALQEINRILKPAGKLIIAHPKGREHINRTHLAIGGPIADDLIPKRSEMEAVLEKGGFVVREFIDRDDLYYVAAEKRM